MLWTRQAKLIYGTIRLIERSEPARELVVIVVEVGAQLVGVGPVDLSRGRQVVVGVALERTPGVEAPR